MAVTRATLRARLGEALGFGEFSARTTTSAGGAAGATLVDSGLGRYPNGYFNGWWSVLTLGPTGSGSYEMREVSNFATTSGTVTPLTAYTAQVASGAAFELYRYNPNQMYVAINQAIRKSFPYLYNPLRNETLIANDWLLNTDFETFAAGAFTSWTSSGSPTLAAETTRVWHGTQSASVVAGAAVGQLTQNLFNRLNVVNWVGRQLSFRRYVFTTATSAGRLRLTFNGTTYTNGDYHDGDDEWESPTEQFVRAAIPANSTQITCVCEVAANQTVFFDGGSGAGAFVSGVPIYRYTIPSTLVGGPIYVSTPEDFTHPESPYKPIHAYHIEQSGETRYVVLHNMLPDGALIRLQGMGLLTATTSDTTSVEVADPRTDLLVAMAARELFKGLASESTGDEREEYTKQEQRWAGEADQMLHMAAYKMPHPPAELDLPWTTVT